MWLYKVEDNDMSDSEYEAVIHVRIEKASTATNKNTKTRTFPVIKYFDNQGPKAIHVLCETQVRIFEHLDITT